MTLGAVTGRQDCQLVTPLILVHIEHQFVLAADFVKHRDYVRAVDLLIAIQTAPHIDVSDDLYFAAQR